MTTQASQKWKAVKLSDLGSVDRGRSRHRPRNDASLYGGVYPFIQTGDIKSANLYIETHSQTYNEKGLAQSKIWEPGTLCITIAANIGESAILKTPACFPDSIVGFQSYGDISDVRYVKYLLDLLKNQFQAISKGTTQDNLSLEKLLSINLTVPSCLIQKKIADVLSAYDDLIRNNDRRIKILERIAQKIYTEWFVSFRFPGYEKVKMIGSGTDFGKVPEGWNIENLSELVDFVRGVEPGSGNYKSSPGLGLVPFLRVGDLGSRNSKIYVERGIVGNKLISREDIVITMDGTVGRVAIGLNGAYSTGIRKLVIIDQRLKREYLYFLMLSDNIQNLINSHAKGTTILHASESIRYMKFILPNEEVMTSFSIFVKPIIDEILVLKEKTRNLSKTRDLLIPQLVTGKLEVKI